MKAKVITTPLLEFLKKKRQKKIDLRNEIRQRKREAEKRRKEEDKRKMDREKKKEEKKSVERSKTGDERGEKMDEKVKEKKIDDRGRYKDEKKDSKNKKNLENDSLSEEKLDSVIPNDPAILEVVRKAFFFCYHFLSLKRKKESFKIFQVVRRSSDKDGKSGGVKTISKNVEETKSTKTTNENEGNVGKPERKYSDFRSGRMVEEKQRKTFYKRDADDGKIVKTQMGNRKGAPDEKGDNYNIGYCSDLKEPKNSDLDTESKRHELKNEVKETKSKFRYSEQRNRDREYRQKTSDFKNPKETNNFSSELSNKTKDSVDKGISRVGNSLKEVEVKSKNFNLEDGGGGGGGSSNTASDLESEKETIQSRPNRRKSLEMERSVIDSDRRRSKSVHDVSNKDFHFDDDKKVEKFRLEKERDVNTPDKDSVQTDDNSKESTESDKMDDESKKADPRAERRIRNKVRFEMDKKGRREG
mgnify:FL=1